MKRLAKVLLLALAALALVVAVFVALNWPPDRPVDALTARWAPPPSQFVELAGMRVHVRDEGPRDDVAPIVLLHGTSASLHTWEGWVKELKDKRRIVSLDLPGFGLTGPFPDEDYSTAHYVRFLAEFFDRLGLQRVVLAGNSFGGYLAWQTAVALPQRVERLVLVDAGGYPLQSRSMPIGFRIASIPVLNQLAKNILPRSVVEASVRDVYGDPEKVTPALVDRYYELTLRAGNRRALVQRFKQPMGGDAGRIRELRMPTLILWGGRDRLIPPENAARFHADVRGSALVIFDALGHVPHEENPGETGAALKRFLATPRVT